MLDLGLNLFENSIRCMDVKFSSDLPGNGMFVKFLVQEGNNRVIGRGIS
jgi:hypothetical protein